MFFEEEKGWGAISSPDLPDGADAWDHFSAIEMDGFRSLETGERVKGGFNEDLVAAVKERKEIITKREGVDESRVPADAVTSSATRA